MESVRFGIVGASGAVGREVIDILLERGVEISQIRAFASERSRGASVETTQGELPIEVFGEKYLPELDIAFFAAGSDMSRQFAPRAAELGVVVIDKASLFRMKSDVPLVVPEVNAEDLRKALRRTPAEKGLIIASPNCSTIQLVVVLKPLLEQYGIRRVVVSTYQSVSGAGQKGVEELSTQVQQIFNHREVSVAKFPHQIAFNCIPHIDEFLPNGYTKEEMKVVDESRKILGRPELRITATAVRVPVFCSHCESVNIETEKYCAAENARSLLRNSPGIVVLDDGPSKQYPLPILCAGTDATYVGRIRNDVSLENGLDMWVVADNLRKGAALNAVQIAEVVVAERFSK